MFFYQTSNKYAFSLEAVPHIRLIINQSHRMFTTCSHKIMPAGKIAQG